MNPIASKVELVVGFLILALLVGLAWALSSANQHVKLLETQLKADQQVIANLQEKNKAFQEEVAQQNQAIQSVQDLAKKREAEVISAQARAAKAAKTHEDLAKSIMRDFKPTGNVCNDSSTVMNNYILERQKEISQ
jgi:Tfp pilus assembly protein PilE